MKLSYNTFANYKGMGNSMCIIIICLMSLYYIIAYHKFNNTRIMNARYAWILYGWYSEEWWRLSNDVNCSEDELAAVLERALVVQQYPIADTSDGAVGGLVRTIAGTVQKLNGCFNYDHPSCS